MYENNSVIMKLNDTTDCQNINQDIQGDSKLLSGFPWPIIFKLDVTK
jgi:hypothetical protein